MNKPLKVAVNLKNVAGVTSDDGDYRPKICRIKKSGTHGLGFHLLYLEDRKGIFVEGVAPRGSAEPRTGSQRHASALEFGAHLLRWRRCDRATHPVALERTAQVG